MECQLHCMSPPGLQSDELCEAFAECVVPNDTLCIDLSISEQYQMRMLTTRPHHDGKGPTTIIHHSLVVNQVFAESLGSVWSQRCGWCCNGSGTLKGAGISEGQLYDVKM